MNKTPHIEPADSAAAPEDHPENPPSGSPPAPPPGDAKNVLFKFQVAPQVWDQIYAVAHPHQWRKLILGIVDLRSSVESGHVTEAQFEYFVVKLVRELLQHEDEETEDGHA